MICRVERCEWGNNADGVCSCWPGEYCPRRKERDEAERLYQLRDDLKRFACSSAVLWRIDEEARAMSVKVGKAGGEGSG